MRNQEQRLTKWKLLRNIFRTALLVSKRDKQTNSVSLNSTSIRLCLFCLFNPSEFLKFAQIVHYIRKIIDRLMIWSGWASFSLYLIWNLMQKHKVLRSAAALSKASVPGREVTWTHPTPSGAVTEEGTPGPDLDLKGITPRTLQQVLDPLSCNCIQSPDGWHCLVHFHCYKFQVLIVWFHGTGHFVIPGMHLTEKGQTSEILSKTLLASSSCTVGILWLSLKWCRCDRIYNISIELLRLKC